MKINNLKINGFGKIENKEINLENKINIIYGKNESGKSTIFNFIVSMLYGCSKLKKGKNISNFEKYKPWNTEEFSGKIKYELDNNKLKLNFNELLLNDLDKKNILEEVIYTISLSMNNVYDNLESVSFLVNNEEIYTININDIK